MSLPFDVRNDLKLSGKHISFRFLDFSTTVKILATQGPLCTCLVDRFPENSMALFVCMYILLALLFIYISIITWYTHTMMSDNDT